LTTHSSSIEAEIEDLKETIKEYENDYKQATGEERKDIRHMIIAARTNLHDLSEEFKALRHQQQGNKQRTRPFIRVFYFQSIPLLHVCVLCFNRDSERPPRPKESAR
jgi:hypothetical protein